MKAHRKVTLPGLVDSRHVVVQVAVAAALAVLLLPALPVQAAELVNAGFEESVGDGPRTSEIRGWFRFGTNVHSVTRDVRSGIRCVKVQGDFSQMDNFCGVFQELPVGPGQRVEFMINAKHASDNPLTGEATAFAKLEFYDASTNFIAAHESSERVTGGTPRDHYFACDVRKVAPTNAAVARFVGILVQTAENETGAVYFDDAEVLISDP